MDVLHSLSLRGELQLTSAELEMSLGLVDDLDLTRREVLCYSQGGEVVAAYVQWGVRVQVISHMGLPADDTLTSTASYTMSWSRDLPMYRASSRPAHLAAGNTFVDGLPTVSANSFSHGQIYLLPHFRKVPVPTRIHCRMHYVSFLFQISAHLLLAMCILLMIKSSTAKIRCVVRYLDKDGSGTVDIQELDKALREFRELKRDMPSLGAGPLTIFDPLDLDQVAHCSFSYIIESRGRQSITDDDILSPQESPSRPAREREKLTWRVHGNTMATVGSRMSVSESNGVRQLEHCTGHDLKKKYPCLNREEGARAPECHEDETIEDTVTAAEISAVFDEAVREFRATGREGSGGISHSAMHQPSANIRQAQVYFVVFTMRYLGKPILTAWQDQTSEYDRRGQ